ncbi:MAG: proline dehydrogenase family protein [Acidobacteriota bacterium]|nr:MAG: proline dehydrogenase family protein [Acidobacteriota bacterium]
MISRTALLYLSRRHELKHFFSKFPGFSQVTRRFIAGENIDDAIEAIRALNELGIAATFDHLGESTTSAVEAESDVREYLHVLDRIRVTGVNSNVSVKLTQLGLDIDQEFCLENTRQIVEAAKRHDNFVRIDMEDSPKTDATLEIFRRLFNRYANVGIVLQAYLYRTEKDLEDVISLGARIRLCKGAYQEPESVAFQDKQEVDANFVKLMGRLLQSDIYHAIATHDEKMISATIDFADRNRIPKDGFEFQMLYGVRRDLQTRLAADGYRVRTYVPYGEYWYPYFMRRLAERPANVWFVLKNLFKG